MGRLTQAWATDREGYSKKTELPAFIIERNRQKALRRRRASIKLMKAYKEANAKQTKRDTTNAL